MINHDKSCHFMRIHDLSWITMIYPEISWIIMNYNELSWFLMSYHELWWTVMACHDSSWMITNYHEPKCLLQCRDCNAWTACSACTAMHRTAQFLIQSELFFDSYFTVFCIFSGKFDKKSIRMHRNRSRDPQNLKKTSKILG